jgi:hypothetical protein
MRTPIVAGIVLLGVLGPPLPRIAYAQNTHRDPKGRFAIDLPPGFKPATEQLGRISVFHGEDVQLFVSAVTGSSDLGRLWRTALDDFTGPGVPPPPAESVSDLELNGNPARLAWYTFDTGSDGTKTPYTALLGAIVLRGSGTGVVCFALLNEKAAARWGEPLRGTFRSIRLPGPPVISGTGDAAKPPVWAAAAEEASSPSPIENRYDVPPLPKGEGAKG